MMKRDEQIAIELGAAALCLELDCNTVFDASAGDGCPRCGSTGFYRLSVWLNRKRNGAGYMARTAHEAA